jgi:hypothetical protein
MNKIRLGYHINKYIRNKPNKYNYTLDPTVKYTFDNDEEWIEQMRFRSDQQFAQPIGIGNYHEWLEKNGFDTNVPNPTNKVVAEYYVVKPLWVTDKSQGIAIRSTNKNDNDYYILMECCKTDPNYPACKILLTPVGCLDEFKEKSSDGNIIDVNQLIVESIKHLTGMIDSDSDD